MNTIKAYETLYTLFDVLNAEYFDDELSTPLITIGSGVVGKSNWCGTFTGDLYTHGTQTFNYDNDPTPDLKPEVTRTEDGNIHSIIIAAEYMARPIDLVAGVMLHEMVHQYCHENNIHDTSNNAVYHNKKFKEECERRDLTVEKSDIGGWCLTSPSDSLTEFINGLELDADSLSIYIPVEFELTADNSKKATKKRYVCPECGMQINAPKDRNIVCGECMKRMDYWDLTFEDDPECLKDWNDGFAESMGWASHVKTD